MNIFTLRLRTLALSAVLSVVGAVLLSGCTPDDEGGGGGGGAANNCGVDGTAGSCKTVVIGGQTWMAENLNYQTGDSWCYDGNNSNCNKYGRLYTWEAAKSACQSVGWRLPTNDEWDALVSAAGGLETAGKALKSTSGWYNNGNGTDSYRFSALPGGRGHSSGSFQTAEINGYWWTAKEYYEGYAYNRFMYCLDDNVYETTSDMGFAYSVRCVQ